MLSPDETATLAALRTPADIQRFLDETPYSTEPIYRSPRSVLRDRRAHCFDGAMLAAAALELLGHPPLLVDLRAARDDDHVLAVYRVDGSWGCVAKSNFPGLRARTPVYKSLREMAMSYFEVYFNMDGERALRSVSRPVNLDRLGLPAWRIDDRCMKRIARVLDETRHDALLTRAQIRKMGKVDQVTWQANMVNVDLDGVYWPTEKRAVKVIRTRGA